MASRGRGILAELSFWGRSELRASRFEWVEGFGVRVSGLGFRVEGFGVRVSGLGFRGVGGFRVCDRSQAAQPYRACTPSTVATTALALSSLARFRV